VALGRHWMEAHVDFNGGLKVILDQFTLKHSGRTA
jgi:hypothetical protein